MAIRPRSIPNCFRKGRSRQFLVGIGLAILVWPLIQKMGPLLFDQMHLTMKLDMLGVWAAPVFVGLHILATVLGVPGVVLTIAGGIGFGLVWGSVWSTIGATLGAMGAFGLARSLLHDPIQTRFGHHPLLAKLNGAVAQRPLNVVLMIRFAPISPFNAVNFLFGLTRISWQSYSLGTLVGIVPGVVAYTWLGVAGHTALQNRNPVPLILAGTVLAILSALPLLCRPLKSL